MNKRNLRQDYLAGAAALRPFHQYSFLEPDYEQMIRDRMQRPLDRDALVEDLLDQNRHLREAEPTLANIEKLRDPHTFTVTTGHQLSLMGGPMYMLYKIATAIRLAAIISEKHPEYQVVPVFWMASEDHDWEEINHFHPDFFQTRSYTGKFEGPVGRHALEPQIMEELEGVDAELRSCYVAGRSLTNAFRQLILKLFGKHGLVVIDGDRPALKKLFLPLMEKELSGEGMGPAVQKSSDALADLGYKVQIYPRPVNLFYMGHGGRDLLFRDGDRFFIQEGAQSWTQSELLAALRSNPTDFSPNVAFRPVYQEHILPNLAYTGGWAEMAYWHQLKQGFEAMDVHFPLLVPRMSATLYEEEALQALLAEGLRPADVGRELHELYDLYLDHHFDESPYQEIYDRIESAFQDLARQIAEVEPTLSRTVQGQLKKQHHFEDNIRKKLRRVLRHQNPAPFEALAEAKNLVQPEGVKQERHLNFTHFESFGFERLIDLILAHCQPEKFEEQWIPLK